MMGGLAKPSLGRWEDSYRVEAMQAVRILVFATSSKETHVWDA